jgi:tetratricopeptide (TPR) repeat protein
MLHVQELVFDVAADEYVASSLQPLPASVDASNVADYCRAIYGEPRDVAWTVLPGRGNVAIGWSFPLGDELTAEFELEEGELVVIPSVELDDGSVRPLFVRLGEQRRMFQALHAAGRVDTVIDLPADEPWFDPVALDLHVSNVVDLVAGQRPREALELADRTLAETDGLEPQQRAWMLTRRGDALSDLGRYDDALAAYLDARAILEAIDGGEVHEIDMEIGLTLERVGRPMESRQRFEDALAGYEAAGDVHGVALCRLNMAGVYRELGDRHGEVAALTAARDTFEELGLEREALDARFNLANAAWGRGDLVTARGFYAEARPRYEALDLPVQVADCDDSLGAVLHEFGKVERAIELHRSAREVYLAHGAAPEAALSRRNLGHALDHAGRFDEAETELAGAEAEYEVMGASGGVAGCAYLLAWVAVHRGDPERALELVADARRIDREAGRASSIPYYDLASGAALNVAARFTEAIPVLEHALAGLRALGDHKTEAEALLELATASAQLRDPDVAERLDAARDLFQSMGLANRVRECETRAAEVPPPRMV